MHSAKWLCLALIAAATTLVFWNALPNAFALDDFYLVVDNPAIETFWPP
jgi:hypothetical protein